MTSMGIMDQTPLRICCGAPGLRRFGLQIFFLLCILWFVECGWRLGFPGWELKCGDVRRT